MVEIEECVELPPRVIRILVGKALKASSVKGFYEEALKTAADERLKLGCKGQLLWHCLGVWVGQGLGQPQKESVVAGYLPAMLSEKEKQTIRDLLPEDSEIGRRIRERLK